MFDLFQTVRERVFVRDAAELYGYHPNRAGFILCPFHGEKSASLKLYPGAGGFHCFGCGRGGSVIDFVAGLFDLDPTGAVRRIDQDFHLNLPLDRPMSYEERAQAQRRREIAAARKQFETWRAQTLSMINSAYRVGHLALRDRSPEEWTDAEVLAVKWMPALEDWADALIKGADEQLEIFRDRKAVTRRCNAILMKKSGPRSATA